jgi:hypothetical protein
MKYFIILPNGRRISAGYYARQWRNLTRMSPERPVSGFDYFTTTAGEVLAELRRGLHDRINRHLTHPTGRDSQADLQADRALIENALQRRIFRTGRNLLRTRYFRRRYPELNHRNFFDG